MSTMNFAKMFLLMGDLSDENRTREEKVAYEQRIVFATMRNQIPDWQPPSDWDSLSLDDKEARLDKIREIL